MRNLDEIPLAEQYLLALQGFRSYIANPDMDPRASGPYGGGCSGEWICWIGGFLAARINRDAVELGMRAFRSGLPRSLNPYLEDSDLSGSHTLWSDGWRYAWADAKAAKQKR
jgi:hypothetical protein